MREKLQELVAMHVLERHYVLSTLKIITKAAGQCVPGQAIFAGSKRPATRTLVRVQNGDCLQSPFFRV